MSGGRTRTGRQVIEWAREAEARGAGEILLTSMDADGTRAGFDCELTARVSEAVEIPVIASGGAGIGGALCPGIPGGQGACGAGGQHLSLRHRRRPGTQAGAGAAGRAGEAAMLIPSIDLMGGRIVQLVRGETLKLAFDDFEYWIGRFQHYPLVQLIDLDAAMRQGENSELIARIAQAVAVPGGGRHRHGGESCCGAGCGGPAGDCGLGAFRRSEPGEYRVCAHAGRGGGRGAAGLQRGYEAGASGGEGLEGPGGAYCGRSHSPAGAVLWRLSLYPYRSGRDHAGLSYRGGAAA